MGGACCPMISCSSVRGPPVRGIPKALVVPEELIADDLPGRRLPHDQRGRRSLLFEGWDREWRPVKAIVVPAHGTTEQPQIASLDSHWLVSLLTRSMLSRQAARLRGYIRRPMPLGDFLSFRLL